jgi:hypothetical protein
MTSICFDKSTFLFLIVVIIIGIIFLDKYMSNKNTKTVSESRKHIDPKQTYNISTTKNTIIGNSRPSMRPPQHQLQHPLQHHLQRSPLINTRKILDNRDRRALVDPLSAPTRRNPSYMYPPFTVPLDIPTRGYPDEYQYMGNLRRTEDSKVVKLFGRQKYRNSNTYEYYGMVSDTYGKDLKIQIDFERELFDSDEIDIEFLDTSIGKFKLYMNKYDEPRYDPYHI